MRYLGGKSRLAREIVDSVVSVSRGRRRYVEPFVGGGSVLVRAAERFEIIEAGDVHPDLIMLWQALRAGWVPPTTITDREIVELERSETPSALRAYAGFALSFGGEWFQRLRNAAKLAPQASRSCVAKGAAVGRVEFRCCSYDEWELDDSTIVYCDPPYAGTTGYSVTWNAARFWAWARLAWDDHRALVAVSEIRAPKGWVPIWQKVHDVGSRLKGRTTTNASTKLRPIPGATNVGGGRQVRADRLFVWSGAL